MQIKKEFKLNILLGLFVSAIISANLLGSKITTLFGVSFSVGAFAFPVTFLITDIVEEVYGKEKTKQFILSAFVSLIFVLLLTLLALKLPPATRFELNSEYLAIFGVSARIFVASIIAFVISQFHDINTFEMLKKKTKGKYLWLRNNVSTIISQFLDTTIFMFIAFYGITPKFTVAFIFALIIPYWLLKSVMAIIDTPLVYLGVKWLKK